MKQICTICETIDSPKTVVQGSFFLEVALWLTFIVPGVIYSIWRMTSHKKVCRCCGSLNIIPINSPVGQRLRVANVETIIEDEVPSPVEEIPRQCKIKAWFNAGGF